MWELKILSGPQVGQKFQIKSGDNLIGRTKECSICISSNGISKQHAKISFDGSKIILSDLQSSNGTFVNGVRIKETLIKAGDKINFHDIFCEVRPFTPQAQFSAPPPPQANASQMSREPNYNLQAQPQGISYYIESVLLPGVYRLGEMFEFKMILGGFVLAFIIMVTGLSTIPMIQITKNSVEKESHRRALTIARNLVAVNQPYFQQGLTASFTTRFAEREDGVKAAYIISSKDGHVIAPASKAGSYPDEPFVHTARKEEQDLVTQVSDDLVGASVPIRAYQADSGSYNIVAHAVVLYNMGSLAIDDGRTISLFVQTMAMALILGFILYFFLYRLIEYPIVKLNQKIDSALKDGVDQVSLDFEFPKLQLLIMNINSALSRAIHGQGTATPQDMYQLKHHEAENLTKIFHNPTLTVNSQLQIIATNSAFDTLLGLSSVNLKGQSIDHLNDQALILNLQDLFGQNSQNPELIATGHIEFNGQQMEIDTHAILGSHGIEYYVCSLKSPGGNA